MAYEKLNLADGQKFTAAHVAHIEEGIGKLGNLDVNITPVEGTTEYNADKTFEEVDAALTAGSIVRAILATEDGSYYLPMVAWLAGVHVGFVLNIGSEISVIMSPDGMMVQM